MTLDVKPEIAAALQSLASAKGLSVEAYLEYVVQKESSLAEENSPAAEGSGMVWENGLFVYRNGEPLPSEQVDKVLREVREEGARRIFWS